ncbi:MAG: hypothetical protein IKB70_08420 [Bacilli bacterium]|nr:hypothetical protein [Bacilli bacterium]
MEEAMKKQGYDRAQIDEAIEKASIPVPQGEILPPDFNSYAEPSYFD